MTLVQKLSIKISEVRQSLNTLAGKESLGDGEAEKVEELRRGLDQAETQYRAAVSAEGDAETRAMAEFDGDAESAERAKLLREVRMTDYLGFAEANVGVSGRAKEVNEALEVPLVGSGGGVSIPWAVLAGPEKRLRQENGNGEQRAFSTTARLAGGIAQRPVLQRLFGASIMEALGVRIEAVPVGRAEFPLLTAGVEPAQVEEGTAAAAAPLPTFSNEVLKPKRLTGRYEFSHEQAAQVPGIEEALRRDLGDAVMAKMSDQILNGDEANNPEQVDGFLTTIAAPVDPGSESDFADYASLAARGVDGIHASSEGEVGCVIGVESYRHSAKIYQTSGSGESASEALRRRAARLMASSFVPMPDNSHFQNGNIIHGAGPNGGSSRGDSVAAVWPGLSLIRDPFSKASQGVILTWVALWDAQTAFRAGAYKRVAFQVA